MNGDAPKSERRRKGRSTKALARERQMIPIAELPPELPPPRGLEAYTATIGEEQVVILGFDLPKISVPAGLSAAEEEIVRAIASGLPNAEIAKQRGTSVRTVANQIASIFSKVGVNSRAELVYLCSRSE